MTEELASCPYLDLDSQVVFPDTVVPIFLNRTPDHAGLMQPDQEIVLSFQDPVSQHTHDVGVRARILEIRILGDPAAETGPAMLHVAAQERVCIVHWGPLVGDLTEARFEPWPDQSPNSETAREEAQGVMDAFVKLQWASRRGHDWARLERTTDPVRLIDLLSDDLLASSPLTERQKILECRDFSRKCRDLQAMMDSMQDGISGRAGSGIGASTGSDLDRLEDRIQTTALSAPARHRALDELQQLKGASNDQKDIMRYLDWLLNLPWGQRNQDPIDLVRTRRVLDQDHCGLAPVKERIIEFMAVQKRQRRVGGTILCLAGPPGVGKTSLGRSIARATGREFCRLALGGVHDTYEIRGFGRTYRDSIPGVIVRTLCKGQTMNPVLLLDEIDKMRLRHGGAAAAMLEVLDPEQNSHFRDTYLDVEIDLSDIMFIATANDLDAIARPLRDRMEVIEIEGYTPDEKLQIAREHLLPELYKRHDLQSGEVSIDDSVLPDIIRRYAPEAGVRQLKRSIEKVLRKALTRIEEGKAERVQVTRKDLARLLGKPPRLSMTAATADQVGVATGLAWTPGGGEILMLEAVQVPGAGPMRVTGNVKAVMHESVQAAYTYVQVHAQTLGIRDGAFRQHHIHVHVPAGATPKEGPSAGLGLLLAILSAMTGRAVRKDVAMTGEITLHGDVLPVGSIRPKLLAADRAGITTVILPADNRRDMEDMPADVTQLLTIHHVTRIDQALDLALLPSPEA